jgi:predicted ester cyclase
VKAETTQLVCRFYDRIWNAGDLGAAEKLVAANFTFRGSLGPEMRGREAFCQHVLFVRSALANYRCDILDCVAEEQKAFAKMRFSGTHVGRFRDYPPTGRAVQWLGAALFQFSGALIVELWVLGDLPSLDQTLRKNAESGSVRKGQ